MQLRKEGKFRRCARVYLKSREYRLFRQTQPDFALKSLGQYRIILSADTASEVRQPPEQCLSRKAGIMRCCPKLFNAKSGCVCRNRRYFRRFRYTLWIFWVKHAAGCRCSQSPAAFCAAVHCLFLQPNRCGKPEQKRIYFVIS